MIDNAGKTDTVGNVGIADIVGFNQMKLTDCKTGDRFDNIPLFVRSAAVSKTKTGRDFLEAELSDGSATARAKCWEWDAARETAPRAGAVFAFSGRAEEYNGATQLIISAIRPAPPGQDDPAAFMPRAPRPVADMLGEIRETIGAIRDGGVRETVGKLFEGNVASGGLAAAPASQKLHHAEIGGLLHHITDTLRIARALCEVYPWLDSDMLNAGVIIHDIGKLRELSIGGCGLAGDYTAEGRLIGHLALGAQMLREAAAGCGISGEKMMLLEHIMLSHHGFREFGSPIQPQTPEALALHLIDSLDAKMFQAADALAGVKPGAFSAKIFALDNRQMYKGLGAGSQEPETNMLQTEFQIQIPDSRLPISDTRLL